MSTTVRVNLPTGETISLNVPVICKNVDLQNQLARVMGVRTNNIALVYQGKYLQPNQTLVAEEVKVVLTNNDSSLSEIESGSAFKRVSQSRAEVSKNSGGYGYYPGYYGGYGGGGGYWGGRSPYQHGRGYPQYGGYYHQNSYNPYHYGYNKWSGGGGTACWIIILVIFVLFVVFGIIAAVFLID